MLLFFVTMDEVRKLYDCMNEEFQHSDHFGSQHIPDDKLESRFSSLCLAFRTDRLTLNQRLSIQENSRDLAEQNVEKELVAVRQAMRLLQQDCVEGPVQETVGKMSQHLDVLEHSIARLSSRAEVFGAVQQERRMCVSMEVMTRYTERLRGLRDTELCQLQTARQMLSEERLVSGHSLDSKLKQPGRTGQCRRRSDVALPRILGGGGMTSLQFSSNMKRYRSQSDVCSQSLNRSCDCQLCVPISGEEPRQRFQTATANVSVRKLVSATLRHGTLERQRRLSCQSSSSSVDIPDERPKDCHDPETEQHCVYAGERFRDGPDPMTAPVQQSGRLADPVDDGGHQQTAPASARLMWGREQHMDTPQPDDSKQMSPDKELASPLPSPSRHSTSCPQRQERSPWLTMLCDVNWRHVTACVIILFAMAVLVVTFISTSNTRSQ